MREPEAGRTIPVSAGIEPAYWRAATADGSDVFYTEGEDLYRFNVERYEENNEPKPAKRSRKRGNGSRAAARACWERWGSRPKTAPMRTLSRPVCWPATKTVNEEQAEAGKATSMSGTTARRALSHRLSTEDLYDEYDWRDFYRANPDVAPATGEKSSRVTPDGATVLFTSQARLTGYDNDEQGELYLYDATSGELTCVSCNPSGTPATSEAYLAGNLSIAPAPERNAFLTRNLSDDGSRVFFQTQEALLPQDKNEQTDVYEWEREGAGGSAAAPVRARASAQGSGGCLYLISTGESDDQSYFGDASADGNDVFFFTRQSLVGQDRDENNDLYDARVDGGIAAQNPSATDRPATGEGCLEPVVSAPVFAAPSSATFVGPADPTPQAAVKPKALTRAQKLARALRACGEEAEETAAYMRGEGQKAIRQASWRRSRRGRADR